MHKEPFFSVTSDLKTMTLQAILIVFVCVMKFSLTDAEDLSISREEALVILQKMDDGGLYFSKTSCIFQLLTIGLTISELVLKLSKN